MGASCRLCPKDSPFCSRSRIARMGTDLEHFKQATKTAVLARSNLTEVDTVAVEIMCVERADKVRVNARCCPARPHDPFPMA